MGSYIGPNGRIYQRAHRCPVIGIAATMLCLLVISVAVVGLPNIAAAFAYLGF